MKIISLNTWGAQAGKELLLDFFKKNNSVDIFCLQEVWSDKVDGIIDELQDSKLFGGVVYNLLEEIENILVDHNYYFYPHLGDHYGLAIFVKKDIKVTQEGEFFVHKEKGFVPKDNIGKHARNLQYIKIEGEQPLAIFNFHGLWNGQGKSDTDDRIAQSCNVVDALDQVEGLKILVGDFNLLPETESLKIIEKTGLVNHIKENDITSTRTSFYKKELKFADYAFTSPELEVTHFEVLPDEVSDHSALLLEIK